jgi:DNA polymerase III subunit gamma/tau
MDNFVVSARKYRPSSFKTVIGQDSITTTLKNAIGHNHLAQAFLFCGPRGVGKTTCARILAKTINCTNLNDDTESCNECESCVSFNNGQSLNIYELDAASNNSVDDIRNLVEQVRYPPHSGQYKIYIIDEVHMLSTSAFNAFLKTLEEPPPYAIFILATTEKHKIIPTILSRCQIFDFNRISVDDIAGHLQWISTMEHVEADGEALHMIAQKADGALRDALSIFDQIVSFAGTTLTYQHVIDNLNILDYDYYFRVTDYISGGDYSNALLLLEEIATEGFDLHHFVNGLSSHFRDLLVSKDAATIALLEVSPGIKERYNKQARSISVKALYSLLEISNKCDIGFKSSQNQRLFTEISLLQMCDSMVSFVDASPNSNLTATPSTSEKKTIDVRGKIIPEKDKTVTPVIASTPKKIIEKAGVKKVLDAKPAEKKEQHSGSTISITERLRAGHTSDEKIEKIKKENTLKNDFTAEQLNDAWNDYAQLWNAKKKPQFFTTLTTNKPQLKENFNIDFEVDNTVQEDDFRTNLADLRGFLSERLQNYSINITCKVSKTTDNQRKPYTNTEKFNKMAEKNPELMAMKKQFDLDLD